MSDLREQIARLNPERLTLLQRWLDRNAPARSSRGSIPRRGTKGPCALSFGQERLWFLDQFDPASPVYNISCAVHIEGPLDSTALQRALDGIVARQPDFAWEEIAASFFSAQEINVLYSLPVQDRPG